MAKKKESKKKTPKDLGRRERQIMDLVYQLGEASVAQVREAMSDPPSYSSVRTMIRLLEGKGLLKHRREGTRYLYRPTQSKRKVSRNALRHLMNTFYEGSASEAVAAIFDSEKMDAEDLKRIESLIKQARKEGR